MFRRMTAIMISTATILFSMAVLASPVDNPNDAMTAYDAMVTGGKPLRVISIVSKKGRGGKITVVGNYEGQDLKCIYSYAHGGYAIGTTCESFQR